MNMNLVDEQVVGDGLRIKELEAKVRDLQERLTVALYAASTERDHCASLCDMVGDDRDGHSIGWRSAALTCAALIRGRGANSA